MTRDRVLAALVAIASSPAFAQDAQPKAQPEAKESAQRPRDPQDAGEKQAERLDVCLTPPGDRWTLRFEPSIWYAAPGGQLRLPGSSTKLELIDFDLDRPRVSPYAELHYRDLDWRLSVAGFSVSLDDVTTIAPTAMQIGTIPVAAGDTVVSSVSVTSGEVVAAAQLGCPRQLNGIVDKDVSLSFEGLAGVRFYDISFDFNAPAGSLSADEFFLTPIVGLKTTINISRYFDIDLQLVSGYLPTGGDRSAVCFEVTNGYTYRPIENVGVQIGYRLSFYDLAAGEGTSKFEYSGAVAGIFAGVVIRF